MTGCYARTEGGSHEGHCDCHRRCPDRRRSRLFPRASRHAADILSGAWIRLDAYSRQTRHAVRSFGDRVARPKLVDGTKIVGFKARLQECSSSKGATTKQEATSQGGERGRGLRAASDRQDYTNDRAPRRDNGCQSSVFQCRLDDIRSWVSAILTEWHQKAQGPDQAPKNVAGLGVATQVIGWIKQTSTKYWSGRRVDAGEEVGAAVQGGMSDSDPKTGARWILGTPHLAPCRILACGASRHCDLEHDVTLLMLNKSARKRRCVMAITGR